MVSRMRIFGVLLGGFLAGVGNALASEAVEEFILPPMPNAYWKNVRDYGAVGDGVHDDTTAFQTGLAALESRRVLYIPAGTYRITATLVDRNPNGINWSSRVVGADPATTRLLWAGPAGQSLIWIDSHVYSSWERLTLDGGGTAGELMRCEWVNQQPGTYQQFKDLTFRNARYGIRATQNNNRMFAETFIKRCRFQNLTMVGVDTASANNQNWFIWHSRFESCAVGAACTPYREVAVYECSFTGSTDCDLRGVDAARGCWSKDSRAFYRGGDWHPMTPQAVLQGNRIFDTLDPVAIDITTGGFWHIHLIDNVIRGRAGAAGPAVRTGGARTLAIGNTFSVTNPFAFGASEVAEIDTTVVARTAMDATEPPRPATALNRGRQIFPVWGYLDSINIQTAINSAVAWEASHPGSRPVVFLGGEGRLNRTVVIPAGTDIQIAGHAFLATSSAPEWTGSLDACFAIRGPTKLHMEDFELAGHVSRSYEPAGTVAAVFRLEGCDTAGSRLLLEDCSGISASSPDGRQRTRGLVADRVDHLRVEAHFWQAGMVKVIAGGLDPSAGVYLFGAVNMVSNPAYELLHGGRLVAQEAYSELFDDIGFGPQHRVLDCRGAGPRPGAVSLDLYSCTASDENNRKVLFTMDSWPGQATLLTQSYTSGRIAISGSGDQVKFLSIASNHPKVDSPIPATAAVLQKLMGFGTVVRQNVTDDNAFIRAALAQRRAAVPAPQPLAAVPAGASDIQLRRMLLWPGYETSIQIVGASASTNLPPLASYLDVLTSRDTPVTVTMDASDVDRDPLTYAILNGPAHGTLGAITGAKVVYTPAAGYTGGDTFTYYARDGKANSNPAKVSLAVTPPSGAGTGLRGEYFDNQDFTSLKKSRVDPTVDFDWGAGSPDPAIGADTFSVRWTGQVQPFFSETYTFTTLSDDGIRLWVDGKLVVDNWTGHAPTEDSGTIALKAGQKVNIKMEYFEDGGGALLRLYWSSPTQGRQIIPKSQLYPTTAPRIEVKETGLQGCATGINPMTITINGDPPDEFSNGIWRKRVVLDGDPSVFLIQVQDGSGIKREARVEVSR